MYQKWHSVLKGISLFDDIRTEELEHLLTCLRPTMKAYAKGETICMVEDPFEGLGIVLRGEVTVAKENEIGDRVILVKLDAGHIFGEMIAFSGMKKWIVNVYASSDVEVMFLPPDRMIQTCQASCTYHTRMVLNMLKILSEKALLLNRKVEYLSIKSMRSKLAKFLLEQYHKAGKTTFMVPLSRNELAEFLNVSRPSMSREIARMKDEGIIDYYQASFKILQLEALVEAMK
ncbi:Crp/Fnr family transcriptional regulator [Anaerotalea alkaliphila]|uniref:Crp/Fnr family transcriptional regulator n=1 Tax=Anaerotalea alkaliphila TaxID=2662126 RepID=A0A7X5HTT7_9FIRM|nr:Crp/Fnr family transcriptional regulator [Anaerotalea alkaliphila]NDL66523.1 Crp/Fnr family transcriptional regulator [Anaerotalea alkaliphila]